MATWPELTAHLHARYILAREEPSWFGIVWTFTYEGLAIEQRVKVERATAFECDWIAIVASICGADQINAGGALRYNGRLAIGALAVINDRCYLRMAAPLDTLTFRDLDRSIELIARESARLKRPHELDRGVPALFTHFEE